jgi:hypothetical protein
MSLNICLDSDNTKAVWKVWFLDSGLCLGFLTYWIVDVVDWRM